MSLDVTIQSGMTIKLAMFEGPLDLLLHLIREHKLDIYDIPIAEVTDQYLHYLSLMAQLDLNIAGEFFVMTATLLEIKSRLLLPKPPPDVNGEEGMDPRAELVEKLLEYERFKNGSELLKEMEDGRKRMFWRVTDELQNFDAPVIPLNLHAMDLLFALHRMLEDVGDGAEEVTSIQRLKMSLRMKMSEIFKRVKLHGEEGITFLDLFTEPRTRYEIVMMFLGVLELLRLHKIRMKQKRTLDEIRFWPAEQEN